MDREGGGGEQSEGRMRAALESSLRSHLGELVTRSGLKLRDIAKILDADEFVVREGRGAREFDTFDVKGFTDREWKAGRHTLALPEKIDHVKHVILPPGDGEITHGDGSGVESKEIIPRTKYLIDVLTDLKISYEIVSGENTANMVRKETYNVFVLDAQKKLVFVNNEEGNATFIVYNVHAPREEWETYASFTKDELGDSGDVARVIYTSEEDWKGKMRVLLIVDVPTGAIEKPSIVETVSGEWKNARQLGREGFASYETIIKIVEEWRTTNPAWFEQRRGRRGPATEHYSPELILKIREAAAERVEAPVGWMVLDDIAKKLVRDSNRISVAITRHLAHHPEWKKSYLSKTAKAMYDHYAPELLIELEREFPLWREPEEGWMGTPELEVLFSHWNVTKHYLLDRFREYEQLHPDQVGWRKLPKSHQALYCSQECVAALREQLEDAERVQKGYISINDVLVKIPRPKPTLEQWAMTLAIASPYLRRVIRRPEDGNQSVWYHPDLVRELERLHRERPWVSKAKDQP